MSDLQAVVAGVLYVLKEGISWRALDVPGIAWETVYGHFRRWAKAGLWDKAYDSDALRELIANKGLEACIPPRSNGLGPADHMRSGLVVDAMRRPLPPAITPQPHLP